MGQCLRSEYPQESLQILVPKVNAGDLTRDGIELGGERVCRETEEEIAKNSRSRPRNKALNGWVLIGRARGSLCDRFAL
jgi:hypothetical protein